MREPEFRMLWRSFCLKEANLLTGSWFLSAALYLYGKMRAKG
jgi:hypothetical protein